MPRRAEETLERPRGHPRRIDVVAVLGLEEAGDDIGARKEACEFDGALLTAARRKEPVLHDSGPVSRISHPTRTIRGWPSLSLTAKTASCTQRSDSHLCMAETATVEDVRAGDSSWWRRVAVPPRVATFLLVAVTTAGATFTIVVAGGAGPQALPVRIVYDVMAALVLIPWLIVASVRPEWRPSSRLMPALIVVLGAFVVATITSRVPRLSLEMLGYAYLLAGVYLLLVTLMRRPEMRLHFERLALVLCVVMCGLYLVQVLQLWVEWWSLVGGLAIPPMRPAYVGVALGSPNPLATLVLILGAFALATIRLPGRRGQVVALVIVGLVGVTTFITTSRGAWLGLAVGLVVTGAAAILASPDARRRLLSVTRSKSGALAALIVVGALALVGTAAALTGRLTMDDGGYRAGFAQASFRMIESAPITGVGPGTWAVLRAQNMNSGDPDQFVAHAHNVYLQTLAEFGVVGALAAVVLAASLGLLIVAAMESDDRSRRRVAYACLFGVVLFAAQQVADVLVNVPALLLALALPIAWLDATAAPSVAEPSSSTRGGSRFVQRLLPLAAAVLTAIVVITLVRVEGAAATAERSVASATTGDWRGALGQISAAVEADPDLPVYRFELGMSAANVGDWEQAEKALSISAHTDDYPYAWLNLAAVRWKLGDVAGARDALARAERQGLQRTPIALAAGWLQQQLGNDEAAMVDYATAIAQHRRSSTIRSGRHRVRRQAGWPRCFPW